MNARRARGERREHVSAAKHSPEAEHSSGPDEKPCDARFFAAQGAVSGCEGKCGNRHVSPICCILRGHEFRNEVQVVAQIFFPGAKFHFQEFAENRAKNSAEASQSSDAPCDSRACSRYCIESFFEGEFEGEYRACAIIYKNGAEIAREIFEGRPEAWLNSRRVLMLAVYHALQKAVGAYTPWGALTGIRPSKLVREWLCDCNDAEVLARLADPFCVSDEKARLALEVAHAERRTEQRIRGTIGLYVSVPFCPSRCVYCSFNTAHKVAGNSVLEAYVSAMTDEMKSSRIKGVYDARKISSIYIGGGTPTFLPENLLERMLYAVCENFSEFFTADAEFTVEAGRPDTLTSAKLKILRKYGVNRIAVNPQTLNDNTLAAIGRGHTAADFFRAFALARDVGFECINTDLIVGLPGETVDDMRRTTDAVVKLLPENITIHTLAIKRASLLTANAREDEKLDEKLNEKLGEKLIEEALSVAAEACSAAGLSPYYLYRQKNMVGLFENVGYSLPGRECLYNVGMMAEVQTISGIGAGAVSKYVSGDKIRREFNAKEPAVYIARQCLG